MNTGEKVPDLHCKNPVDHKMAEKSYKKVLLAISRVSTALVERA